MAISTRGASRSADAGPPVAKARPRVAGEREQEIFAATLDVLAEVGYDRLTMDAVAIAARASKATLYRRWNGKVDLIVEAITGAALPEHLPDTGTLRGDLIALFCDHGGLVENSTVTVFMSVLTAIGRDADFAEAFRRDFVEPRAALVRTVFERAQRSGVVCGDADLDLLSHVVPAVVVHHIALTHTTPGPDLVSRVVDHIVLPAATCRGGCQHSTHEKAHP